MLFARVTLLLSLFLFVIQYFSTYSSMVIPHKEWFEWFHDNSTEEQSLATIFASSESERFITSVERRE